MKTPLTKDLQKGYLPGTPDLLPIKHFTLESFIQDQRALGRTIGMVVDLSNHDCLYADDLPTFAADGLVYRHFQFVAKRLPEPESCKKVSEAITAFVMANSDKFVAIHCSYGFNRTGFVVCSYLIEELGVAPQEALDAFAQSRPPGVKHQDFVQELLARYQYIAPPPPPPPEEGGGSSDAVSGPQPVSPSLGGGAAAEGKRGGEGGGGGGEQKKGKPQSAEAGGQLPDQQQQQQAPLQQLFSPTSLRRGGAAMPVPQVHFHHEVNNDSLGMISGEALLAELEQELGSAQAAQLAASAQLKKTGMNGRPINCMLS